jgi:hypothetical protein
MTAAVDSLAGTTAVVRGVVEYPGPHWAYALTANGLRGLE